MRVSLKEEGASGGEKEGMEEEEELCEKSSRGLFTANNCLEKHNLRRVGSFGVYADYPLLFDS